MSRWLAQPLPGHQQKSSYATEKRYREISMAWNEKIRIRVLQRISTRCGRLQLIQLEHVRALHSSKLVWKMDPSNVEEKKQATVHGVFVGDLSLYVMVDSTKMVSMSWLIAPRGGWTRSRDLARATKIYYPKSVF